MGVSAVSLLFMIMAMRVFLIMRVAMGSALGMVVFAFAMSLMRMGMFVAMRGMLVLVRIAMAMRIAMDVRVCVTMFV